MLPKLNSRDNQRVETVQICKLIFFNLSREILKNIADIKGALPLTSFFILTNVEEETIYLVDLSAILAVAVIMHALTFFVRFGTRYI